MFCNLKKDYPNFLNTLLEISQEDPEVNYYLLIGPKSTWKGVLVENNILTKYEKAKNAYLKFTI